MDANDFNELSKEELLDIIWAYDDYVQQVITENEGEPVCLLEFVNNDYQEMQEHYCVNCGKLVEEPDASYCEECLRKENL